MLHLHNELLAPVITSLLTRTGGTEEELEYGGSDSGSEGEEEIARVSLTGNLNLDGLLAGMTPPLEVS